MKTRIKNVFVLPFLVIAIDLLLGCLVTAQTFTTLHNFSDGGQATKLVLSGNTLFATTMFGGTNGDGSLFVMNTDGTGFTNLYNFSVTDTNGCNSDGAFPSEVILAGGTLYGTAFDGGTNGNGTVFAINTNGAGFTVLHNFSGPYVSQSTITDTVFTNSDGAHPDVGLILSGNTLYGAAAMGGTNGNGTVFAINTNGTGFTVLHTFSGPFVSSGVFNGKTNSDGAFPGRLALSGNTLYGAAAMGGTNGNGTVFTLDTNGTGFDLLHTFSGPPFVLWGDTNNEGAAPGHLVLSGDTLFGTASDGGSNGSGAVFKLNTSGSNFTILYTFTANALYGTNKDGACPCASLILSGNTLYGMAAMGGTGGSGTVFSLNTNGTGFTTLYNFTPYLADNTNSDGGFPDSVLLSGKTLYGTTADGGRGRGTVFSLSYPSPRLSITPAGTNVILTWPTAVAGFSYSNYNLESTTNLAPTSVWTTISGQSAVTNPISGNQKFYRLRQ